jgi:hypothetical protein
MPRLIPVCLPGTPLQENFIMRVAPFAKWSCCLVLLAVVAPALQAQTPAVPAKSASQFYLEYRAAFEKAQKVEEVLPFLAASNRKQIEDTPAADRVEMFELLKMFDTMTNVKVTKEDRTGAGATLTVEGVGDEKKKATGTVRIVREGGAWKIGEEKWSGAF